MRKTLALSVGRALAGDLELLRQALEGSAELANALGVGVAENWAEARADSLRYTLAKLAADEDEANWGMYFVLHGPDNKLIGSGGYHGKPTAAGVVEIGYEVLSAYQHRGIATDFARALVANAFAEGQVAAVVAHTLAEATASTSVLLKNGFERVAETTDPTDGRLWQWELKRPGT